MPGSTRRLYCLGTLGPRLADAIQVCDEFLKKQLFPGSQSRLDRMLRRAGWRAEAATWAQMRRIIDTELQKRPAIHGAELEAFRQKIRALTKGEAMEMICSMDYRKYVGSRSR